MQSTPNCCSIQADLHQQLNDDLKTGRLFMILHKAQGRMVYITPEELASLKPEEYRLFPVDHL